MVITCSEVGRLLDKILKGDQEVGYTSVGTISKVLLLMKS